jgi:hypothetical protein
MLCTKALDLVLWSTKFTLPTSGMFIEDPDLRAVDRDVTLRLPYPCIALEYCPGGQRSIVFARQWGEEWEGSIAIDCAFYHQTDGTWTVTPGPYMLVISSLHDHGQRTGLNMFVPDTIRSLSGGDNSLLSGMASPVLHLLNALACSNVHIERQAPAKQPKKSKGALPFDAYHYLTIDVGRQPGDAGPGLLTSHRSPREHLRRGHIRRLDTGKKIWVNAHVVAGGRGAGKVTKDYVVRNSQLEQHHV